MAPLVSSELSFIGGIHIGARALHVLNLIWFCCITGLSQWGGGVYFLVQLISTCLPSGNERGGGVGTLWLKYPFNPGRVPAVRLLGLGKLQLDLR
jgi:hypothetical protein